MQINTNTEKLLAHKDGAAGWITFNNPAKRNAMSFEMWQGLDIALNDLLADNAIRVVDAFGIDEIRTKQVVAILQAFEAAGRILVVAPGRDEKLQLSARNLPDVEVILADSLNVVDLLKADLVVIEQPALARMEEVYA